MSEYLLTNEELQDSIIQTNAMIKAYGEKIPDYLIVHQTTLLELQLKRARLIRYEKEINKGGQ